MPAPRATAPDYVASLAKGLEVLSAFEQADLLSNQELVALTGMPKATVSRFTSTLEKLGYLQLDEKSRRWRIGARVLSLTANVMDKRGLQQVARSHMRALAEELDVSVLLATREHLSMMLLDIVRAPLMQVTINKQVGDRLAIDTTSLGLAYLVASPTQERVKILAALQRAQLTDWTRYRADVERVHQEYRELGYVVSRRVRGGVLSAVAVPIVVGDSEVFVLSCAGPAQQFSRPRFTQRVGARTMEVVTRIASEMAGARLDAQAARRAGPVNP